MIPQAEKFHSVDDIRDSIESLYAAHGKDQSLVYWMLLLISIVSLVLIATVKIDLSVGGYGQIRPEIARLQVYSAVSGNIKELHVVENQLLGKGDVILRFDAAMIEASLEKNRLQQEENDRALSDLEHILSNSFDPVDEKGNYVTVLNSNPFMHDLVQQLESPQFIREHAFFVSKLRRLTLNIEKAEHNLSRYEVLHQKDLISDYEFDEHRFLVDSNQRETELLILESFGKWQAERVERELRQTELQNESTQLHEQLELYTVRAPIKGVAIGFNGLHSGLFLPQNQYIGEISPEGNLQADVYIIPKDIGFLYKGQSVQIQVDAFPYTEWGTLQGEIREITDDIVQYGEQIAFKAIIDLQSETLTSSSGVEVKIRKGMTINARFLIRKQTLFNLLFEKFSKSLDPTGKPTN